MKRAYLSALARPLPVNVFTGQSLCEKIVFFLSEMLKNSIWVSLPTREMYAKYISTTTSPLPIGTKVTICSEPEQKDRKPAVITLCRNKFNTAQVTVPIQCYNAAAKLACVDMSASKFAAEVNGQMGRATLLPARLSGFWPIAVDQHRVLIFEFNNVAAQCKTRDLGVRVFDRVSIHAKQIMI